jgi:hypothetical protein
MSKHIHERAGLYLEQIDPSISGCHGHNQLLYAASVLVNGFALGIEESKALLLTLFNTRCEPPWPERELDRKLKVALTKGSRKGRGHLLDAGIDIPPLETVEPRASSLAVPKWPAPDLDAIDRIVRDGPGAFDLWENSPCRWEDESSRTEEIIEIVFPGDPYLCAARSAWNFATRRRSAWRGLLPAMPLIVPNPMVAPSGLTREGEASEHALQATGRRIYQVIEFDFTEVNRTGQPTIYAPLLKGWEAAGISTLDACAALSSQLAKRLPSWLLFLSSGGKSGHSWFLVRGLPVSEQRAFFAEACCVGADPQLWCRSQFVRLPDGRRRENGRRQAILYFDPLNAVTL